MTNTEAITKLTNIMHDDHYAWSPAILTAFGMAVDALKGADGDCISRQAAIDAILAVTGNSSVRELYEHVQEHELSDMWSGGVNAAIDIIIAVPSAQSETAKRIVGKSRNGMTLWYQCDMCNEPVDAQDNFCRGCGRRLIDE